MKLKWASLSRLYLLAAFSTVLLAMGQGMGIFALAMVVAAVVAYVLTERQERCRLSARASNVLAVIGSGLFLLEVALGGIFTLAIAHLAVYMQFIILFQKKNLRSYWSLVLLALMQLPVAAVMNLQMWFGMLLVAYLFMALSTLTLFYLYRESLPYQHQQPTAPTVPHEARARRWPLADMSSEFSSTVAGDWSGKPRLLGLRWQTGWLGVLTLPLAVAFFMLSPRATTPGWAQPMEFTQLETGFDTQVQLGQMGALLESDEPVMQVTLRDCALDAKIQPSRGLLFAGGILLDYANGSWTGPKPGAQQLRKSGPAPELVCQEIEIQPLDAPVLFAAGRVRGAMHWDEQAGLLRDYWTHTLIRPEELQRRTMRYRAYTTFEGLYEPYARRKPPGDWDRERSLALPREQLPTLIATAESVVAGIPANQIEQRALALNEHFHSGAYSYVLAGEIADPTLDPVEDFVRNRKSGHCEYFASSLALMLRAVGIHSRVVNGFRNGEWNRLGEFIQVQQKHAHSWVEAYVPGQGWLTLDPTPAQLRELPTRSLWARMREYRSYFQTLWSRHVVGFDARQQKSVLASPLSSAVQTWRNWGQRQLGRPLNLGRDPVPWELALMLLGVVLIGAGLGSMLFTRRASRDPVRRRPRLRRWLRLWRPRRAGAPAARVDFYERLVRLLARHAWQRQPYQTPREFAGQVRSSLEADPQTAAVAIYPEQLTDAYYRVRYGGKPLNQQLRHDLRTALQELSRTLRGNGRKPNGPDAPQT